MSLNDRDDCKVNRFFDFNPNSPSSFPTMLRVGEKAQFYSPCATIRTNIYTDAGSYTYSFNGD
jgi:hypothetical protein